MSVTKPGSRKKKTARKSVETKPSEVGEGRLDRLKVALLNEDGQLRMLVNRHSELMKIISDRAKFFIDEKHPVAKTAAYLPGLKSGYMTVGFRRVGTSTIPEAIIDSDLMRELTRIENQAGRICKFIDPRPAVNVNVNQSQSQHQASVSIDSRTRELFAPRSDGRPLAGSHLTMEEMARIRELADACPPGTMIEIPEVPALEAAPGSVVEA